MKCIESASKYVFVIVSASLTTACGTYRAYEGPKRSQQDTAHITGDSPLGGLPVFIIVRQVDGVTIGAKNTGVDVLPGAHTLLIDCTVTESNETTRHHLDVEVDAGVRYKLVASTARGNRECVDVQMVTDK